MDVVARLCSRAALDVVNRGSCSTHVCNTLHYYYQSKQKQRHMHVTLI